MLDVSLNGHYQAPHKIALQVLVKRWPKSHTKVLTATTRTM